MYVDYIDSTYNMSKVALFRTLRKLLHILLHIVLWSLKLNAQVNP